MQYLCNKTSAAILLGLLVSGCVSTTNEYRRFQGSFVADNESLMFQRVQSENTLLEIYHFSGSVFTPGAFGGYSLFIEGSSDSIKKGNTIELPSSEVVVSYYSDYHHLGKVDKDISGIILIKDVSDKHIIIDVDITIIRNQKRIKLVQKFENYKIEEYEERLP